MIELSQTARALLEAPNLAFLATAMADGSPQVTPVWIALEDGFVTINTATGRVKERNMRRDPRVAISVAAQDDFYARTSVRGRVVEMIVGEEADRHIDALALKYIGQERYPDHNDRERRVKVVIEPLSEAP
jgi:PPOX class probable F420-dependent enzyme